MQRLSARLGLALLCAAAPPDIVAAQPLPAGTIQAISTEQGRTLEPSQSPRLLFASGFEGAVELGPLAMYPTGAWQEITGIDATSGFTWPPKIWGGTSRFQLIAGDSEQVTAATLPDYMYNELQSVTGHDGTSTRALFSTVQKSVGGALENWDRTQNDFVIFPGVMDQGDLYVSYWLKLQPDLLERMTVDEWDSGWRGAMRSILPGWLERKIFSAWAGRVITDWKTGPEGGGGGDYRILFSVYADRSQDRLYWNLRGDNEANGGLSPQTFWELNNAEAGVPIGQWIRVEMFVHRSGKADGRVWIAVDGQTLFDRYGPNLGVDELPWNRVFPFLNYSSGQSLPAYQWVDDLEIWNGFPATASVR